MKTTMKLLFGSALFGASTLSMAAAFDGSEPLLCAVTDTVSCDSQGECVEGSAESVNLPVFLRLDAQNKAVQSVRVGGEHRTSEILSAHEEKDALVLLGVEHGRGWSATISQSSGELTATVAEEGIGYIIFGACTTQ
jgi:hypothetical protein